MCCQVYIVSMEKMAEKFRNFPEAEKADRDFYKNLTGNERLQIQLESLNHDPAEKLEGELLELLNSRGVDYVIVGTHSLAFHGRPRSSGDLDILIRPTETNARRVVDLLNQFGFGQSGFKEADFLEPEQIIQLGCPPNRIDLFTSISGVPADEAFATKVSATLYGIPVPVLGKDALIRNERAVARPQDLADIDSFGGVSFS